MDPKHKIDAYIRRDEVTGAVEIDIVPQDEGLRLTGQQVVDAVAELVLWHEDYWEDSEKDFDA